MLLPTPSLTNDPKSFAYPSARVRWPKIVDDCINDLKTDGHSDLIPQFEQLKQDLIEDKPVTKFTEDDIKVNPDVKYFNDNFPEGSDGKPLSWQNGPWLYLECHMYQIMNLIFIRAGIPDYDVFNNLKNSTLVSSEVGIVELSKKLSTFDYNMDAEAKLLFFKEFLDISLWGNATDLSLLAGDVTLEDIKSVQGEKVRKENEKNILANDTNKVYQHLTKRPIGPIDFVLDNSGFELFSDLVLAIFLLEANLCNQIRFHCKKVPWFVSDVLIKDFNELFVQLDKFNNPFVDQFTKTIKDYMSSGKITTVTNKFWTLANRFWDLPKFEDAYTQFKDSNLMIFKGDLNYRKLTGDCWWDKTTPFSTAIQDLATANLPILSLRTCKADVVVGLPAGTDEKLKQSDGDLWYSTGKYAVVSFFNPDEKN